jgi:lipopolysaccharide transport system ATP-binding protein
MAHPAVLVTDLSKRYTLGEQASYRTIRETLTQTFTFRRRPRRERAEHWALRDVSFEIARGEVVGIIGRNGAGKSTLLKILSRITEPTGGRVEIRGRVASLLEVGTGFHPELTGRENVFLNGAILGMKRAEITRKFDDIVGFAETEKFVDTPVKHYSSGMYLRLAFAVAAHLDSEILVVDEVLAVGDQAFQQRCLNKMGEAARSGRTVLLVSHNMAAVESLCEQAYLIADGRLAMSGPVQAVVRHYASMATSGVQRSLADRTDRRGDGAFRFTGVRIHEDGKSDGPLFSGCDTELAFDYVTTGPSKKLHIAISFLDQHDRMLFACDNEHAGDALGVGAHGTLRCKIRDLPLSPGTYRISVWASLGGQVSDYVQHVAEFAVAPADFFGTGRLPDHPKFGPFLVRHRWSHDES